MDGWMDGWMDRYEIYHFNYAISGYLSNEVPNVNAIYVRILYSSTRKGEKSFAAVYHVYYVSKK
jgi:hypothetical protein